MGSATNVTTSRPWRQSLRLSRGRNSQRPGFLEIAAPVTTWRRVTRSVSPVSRATIGRSEKLPVTKADKGLACENPATMRAEYDRRYRLPGLIATPLKMNVPAKSSTAQV
jgi:hypothetical protein